MPKESLLCILSDERTVHSLPSCSWHRAAARSPPDPWLGTRLFGNHTTGAIPTGTGCGPLHSHTPFLQVRRKSPRCSNQHTNTEYLEFLQKPISTIHQANQPPFPTFTMLIRKAIVISPYQKQPQKYGLEVPAPAPYSLLINRTQALEMCLSAALPYFLKRWRWRTVDWGTANANNRPCFKVWENLRGRRLR